MMSGGTAAFYLVLAKNYRGPSAKFQGLSAPVETNQKVSINIKNSLTIKEFSWSPQSHAQTSGVTKLLICNQTLYISHKNLI